MQISSQRRIGLASSLVIACIAVALAVTVWSYRNAVHTRSVALGAVREETNAQTAETYLWRQREVMNEYLLTSSPGLLVEARAMERGFEKEISQVGIGEPEETGLVARAIRADERLVATFQHRIVAAGDGQRAKLRLNAQLSAAEDDIFEPLRALRRINALQGRDLGRDAIGSSGRALVAAILAGVLAIGGGLAFGRYAVRLVRQIRAQNEDLRKHDRMKDDFVASVSHELRTPLTSIRGYLELLTSGEVGELNEEQERFLSVVDRNADRLLHVVGDLLFVSQVEAGIISLEKSPFELIGLLTEAVDAALPAAEAKDIAIQLNADHVAEVDADRARLAQVFDNLISNAIKFTPPGGRIDVRAVGRHDHVHIEIADSGMGISAEDQPRLFRRFFRTSTANEQAIQGTGLGLAIVKAIVDGHGGRVTVESEVGSGTTFCVELPLAVREMVAV
jgi:signal transduction histidine kinase